MWYFSFRIFKIYSELFIFRIPISHDLFQMQASHSDAQKQGWKWIQVRLVYWLIFHMKKDEEAKLVNQSASSIQLK